MNDQPTADFNGCNSECRKAGKHSLRWSGCEHATPPEPTVSMSVVYTDPADGYPAIGFDTYTVPQLAELIEPALRTIKISLGPNARALLERGQAVGLSAGEYASLALAAADAIVHRHDEERPAVPVSSPPPNQTAEPDCKFEEGCHRVVPCDPGCAVAAAELHHRLAVLPPPADRAAVLLWAADFAEQLMDERYGPDCSYGIGGLDVARDLRRLAAEVQQQPDTVEARCPSREPLDEAQCSKQAGHDGPHSDRPGRIWYPAPVEEECCGVEPPTRADDPSSQWGDCWCTLQPGHDGEHRCEPCTKRHGAPGWSDEPAAGSGRVAAEARPETVCSESVAHIADDEEG